METVDKDNAAQDRPHGGVAKMDGCETAYL